MYNLYNNNNYITITKIKRSLLINNDFFYGISFTVMRKVDMIL